MVSERCKAFAAAHRSGEDRQAYISTSRRASSVIAKAKAEAWQTTCSSLSPKSNPKSVHSLLHSIAGSPSSSSSFSNFPTVLLPGNRLRSMPITCDPTFPFLSQRPCVAEPEATSSELRQVTCSVESHSSFCSLSLPLNFLQPPTTSPCTLPLVQTKLKIFVLQHLREIYVISLRPSFDNVTSLYI